MSWSFNIYSFFGLICCFFSYPYECVDVCGFMSPCESPFVAFSVCSDVFFVPQPKFFDRFLDDLVTSICSHGLRAETPSSNIVGDATIKETSSGIILGRDSKSYVCLFTCSLCEHQHRSSRPGEKKHSREVLNFKTKR